MGVKMYGGTGSTVLKEKLAHSNEQKSSRARLLVETGNDDSMPHMTSYTKAYRSTSSRASQRVIAGRDSFFGWAQK